jgi:hypothetical protein
MYVKFVLNSSNSLDFFLDFLFIDNFFMSILKFEPFGSKFMFKYVLFMSGKMDVQKQFYTFQYIDLFMILSCSVKFKEN